MEAYPFGGKPGSKRLRCPNDLSIIEAYATIADGGYAFPFGIYADEIPVGFLMIGFTSEENGESYYDLWRLMIDAKYQHRGYASQAIPLALALMQTQPCGKASACRLSYEPENSTARALYHTFGF